MDRAKYEDRIRVGDPPPPLSDEIKRKLFPDKVNHQSTHITLFPRLIR